MMFEESYRRIYPYNSLACRVLGFTLSGNQGNWGIEQQYNSELNGTNGRSYYYFNEELTQEQTVKEAVDGNSVVSTIDMQIQKIIEDKLKKFDESIGSKGTNILVMNPQTGEILGMAGSHPYNLNTPMDEENLKMLFSQDEIDQMKAYTKKKEKRRLKRLKKLRKKEGIIRRKENSGRERKRRRDRRGRGLRRRKKKDHL